MRVSREGVKALPPPHDIATDLCLCVGRGNARRKSVPRFFLKLRNLQIVANKNFETKKIKKVPMNENEKRSFNFYLKITKIFEDKYKKQT